MDCVKRVCLVTATILFSYSSYGQVYISDLEDASRTYTHWGVKAGGNFQLLSGFPFVQNYSSGALAGAYIERRKDSISWRAELTASTAGFTTTQPVAHNYGGREVPIADTASKGDFSAVYINLPLTLKITPQKHFSLLIGVQFTHMLTITDNNGAFTKQFGTVNVLGPDNAFALVGMETDITKKLRIGATYSIGFMDVNNQKYVPLSDAWMVSSGQIYLVYQIKKWDIKI